MSKIIKYAICPFQAEGAMLWEPRSAEEWSYATESLATFNVRRRKVWIGATDEDVEDQFVYCSDNVNLTHQPWENTWCNFTLVAPGKYRGSGEKTCIEPNNLGGNENCVVYTKTLMNDVRCDREFGYICQINLY